MKDKINKILDKIAYFDYTQGYVFVLDIIITILIISLISPFL